MEFWLITVMDHHPPGPAAQVMTFPIDENPVAWLCKRPGVPDYPRFSLLLSHPLTRQQYEDLAVAGYLAPSDEVK